MAKHNKSKRQQVVFNLLAVLLLTVLLVFTSASYSIGAETAKEKGEKQKKDKVIISKTITIEGAVERPKIIFIVPRAKLWDSTLWNKDFSEDILRPYFSGS